MDNSDYFRDEFKNHYTESFWKWLEMILVQPSILLISKLNLGSNV